MERGAAFSTTAEQANSFQLNYFGVPFGLCAYHHIQTKHRFPLPEVIQSSTHACHLAIDTVVPGAHHRKPTLAVTRC